MMMLCRIRKEIGNLGFISFARAFPTLNKVLGQTENPDFQGQLVTTLTVGESTPIEAFMVGFYQLGDPF